MDTQIIQTSLMSEFYGLPVSLKKKILDYNQAILDIKQPWASTYFCSSEVTTYSHAVGKLAECVFSYLILGSLEYVDWTVGYEGDVADFILNGFKVDVKCTAYWKDPWLTLNNSSKNKSQDIFVLTSLRPFTKQMYLMGFMSQPKAMSQTFYNKDKDKFIVPHTRLSKDWNLLKQYLGVKP